MGISGIGGGGMYSPYVPAGRGERCTANTDRVDREIENLKEKKQQIEQQMKSCDDLKKMQDLEKQLAGIESELQEKDNDTYRRQHTQFS